MDVIIDPATSDHTKSFYLSVLPFSPLEKVGEMPCKKNILSDFKNVLQNNLLNTLSSLA
jgi:hypothetical protein